MTETYNHGVAVGLTAGGFAALIGMAVSHWIGWHEYPWVLACVLIVMGLAQWVRAERKVGRS